MRHARIPKQGRRHGDIQAVVLTLTAQTNPFAPEAQQRSIHCRPPRDGRGEHARTSFSIDVGLEDTAAISESRYCEPKPWPACSPARCRSFPAPCGKTRDRRRWPKTPDAPSRSRVFSSVITSGSTQNRWASSAGVLSPLRVARATFTLNTALQLRLDRCAIIAPRLRHRIGRPRSHALTHLSIRTFAKPAHVFAKPAHGNYLGDTLDSA